MNQATTDAHRIAAAAIDDLLAADTVGATWLGDHRFDDQLPDLTESARRDLTRRIDAHLAALDGIDDLELVTADRVDLEILRAALTGAAFDAQQLQAPSWNPMDWNPGTALHLLLVRDFAPLADRLASARERLADVPRFIADAMRELGDMPQVHVETAIAQLQGTRQLVEQHLGPQLLAQGRSAGAETSEVIEAGLRSLDDFTAWLGSRLPDAQRSPRLGPRMYAAMLWHRLDDPIGADTILQRAEQALDSTTAALREAAAEYLGVPVTTSGLVSQALGQVAQQAPVTDATVLRIVSEATMRTRQFTLEHDLVTVPDVDTQIIEMPQIHRGVAVAYCDAPGPLEQARVPTFVAVSPTPAGWPADRVASFYREYNAIQLHDLTIHEAFPGHVLQLAHAQRQSASLVRRFGMSGTFVEGWAVVAEELLVERGYAPTDDVRSALAIRLQQLKMQARMTINAILDVRVHCGDLTEPEALDLMMRRGFQEEGEAVGKWRRALLTAGQLPTYFVGYQAVREIIADLRVLHPDWTDRQVHDLVLSYGSPAPRHLRALIGI
ncbi:MAG: DUF885 family protein [Actinomycetales bacterium]|nr:DUF885 family protein [Actinomycetales bacterium]